MAFVVSHGKAWKLFLSVFIEKVITWMEEKIFLLLVHPIVNMLWFTIREHISIVKNERKNFASLFVVVNTW